jgi:hypothetical protein
MLSFLQIGALVASKKVLDGSFKEWAADDDKFRKEHPKEDKTCWIPYVLWTVFCVGLYVAWFLIVK